MRKAKASGSGHTVAGLLALTIAIGLLATTAVRYSHRQATVEAERAATVLVRLLAEQTERTIQAVDFTLIGMREALLASPDMPPHDPAYRASLKERLNSLPYVRALFVVGSDGRVIHDSDFPSHEINLADLPYIQLHRREPSLGLHIGQPLQAISNGVWFISLSRRINKPDGSFGGVVLAAVDPRYFKGLYKDLSIGEDDLIALSLRDGTLLARSPDHDGTIGKNYADSPVRQLAIARGSGVTWSTSPIDGRRRLVGCQTVADGAAIVVAGLSERTIYDSWVEHAAIVGGGAVLVWLLAAGLTLRSLEYRRREQQERARLAQVQRLELMGRIAGGIAHDLGNTIKIARTTFSLLKPSLVSQQDALALVEDADKSLKSAFDIIDRLLAFARRQELSPRATDLEELIVGFAPILRQAAGPGIEVEVVIAERPVCLVDPLHLESALLNLVLNSKDAMPEGGHIVIELRETQALSDSKRVRGRPPATEAWAEIVVRDDGMGMAKDVQDRAFEPFFTTRSAGNGLGLSQVLGFVQQSAGKVYIESNEGVGTKVRLLFPKAPDTAAPVLASSSAGPPGAAATVSP
jgi:signal transduction histidine kinase